MVRKAGLTVIANYLEALERPLRMKGIYSDCIINGCSPLSMQGELDSKYQKYSNDINIPMQTLLNIRKNLSAMLSRNPDRFNQNYNLQPYARNVRYSNETDYIVIMNTAFGYAHFIKGDMVYSDTYPQNDFINELKTDKSFQKQSFPFENGFNWKFFYDKFIDAVLKEYDSKHIILVRVNSAQWYMDSQEICAFDEKSSKFRSRIEEIDNYFLERTHCLCIDEQYNFIPEKNSACAFTYSSKSPAFYQKLVNDIEEIIDGKTEEFEYDDFDYNVPLAVKLSKKMSCDIIRSHKNELEEIQNKRLSLDNIKNNDQNSDFFKNVILLEKNIIGDYTLSDYARKLLNEKNSLDSKIDFKLLELYTKYIKLNINDVIAFYMLYSRCENKIPFKTSAQNVLDNCNCLPMISIKKMRRKNVEFLNNYPYIHTELKNVLENDTFYIRVENNIYLYFNLLDDDFIKKVDMKIGKNFNHMNVIDNGYICPIEQADALCSSYAFYIERAKRKETNRPVTIEFYTVDEFSDSLNIYDYTDLLNNENFVITLSGKKVDTIKFKAICDLDFLTQKGTRIGVMHSGFTDQICHYMLIRKIQEICSSIFKNLNIYYDDTFYLYTQCFNGFEIPKFSTTNITGRMLSNLLSSKLKRQINGNNKLPDILFKNGLSDTAIFSAEEKKLGEYKLCNKVLRKLGYNENPVPKLKNAMDFDPVFYYTLIRPEVFFLDNKFSLNNYITFPDLDDKNKKIANDMLSCDAVVIHMRLGDFVSVGYDVDNEYYIESINKLMEISEYSNKKYYVFSDNIPYVKEHSSEFGLDLLESSKITFVDHNKGENSFRDMQLMTYAKVIIASGSGVVRMAFIMSKRCEQIYLWKTDVLDLFEKIGRKNKYVIGNYSRSYRLDYSKFKPKALQ